MSVQSEAQLEHELIAQLKNLGYSQVDIKDETQLLSNLKIQVERANDISAFSANEWAQVLNHLKAGNSFNCAKVLRNRFPVTFDDGSTRHIDFLFADPSKTSIKSPIRSPSIIEQATDIPVALTSHCSSMAYHWSKLSSNVQA